MQGLSQWLVVEDDATSRRHFRSIFDFLGESCVVIASQQIEQLDWSMNWIGFLIGSLQQDEFAVHLYEHLTLNSHIPYFMVGQTDAAIQSCPQCLGVLTYPLRYPQLSAALDRCRDFLAPPFGEPAAQNSVSNFELLVDSHSLTHTGDGEPYSHVATAAVEIQEREMLASLFTEILTDDNKVEHEIPDDGMVWGEMSDLSLLAHLPPDGVNLKAWLSELESSMIAQALDIQDGKLTQAAEMLGMRRATLVKKMKKYQL